MKVALWLPLSLDRSCPLSACRVKRAFVRPRLCEGPSAEAVFSTQVPGMFRMLVRRGSPGVQLAEVAMPRGGPPPAWRRRGRQATLLIRLQRQVGILQSLAEVLVNFIRDRLYV